MTDDRHALPQLGELGFLTDGGLESTLIRHDDFELPFLAAFQLLMTDEGRRALNAYYARFLEIALRRGLGLILQTPTWRANPDWIARLSHPETLVDDINGQAVAFLRVLRDGTETPSTPLVVSGSVGPRADGYRVQHVMATAEAQRYHARQIAAFARAGADMAHAMTMMNVPEAVGIVRAAVSADLPIAVSFAVERDGRLPSGETLEQAIAAVDVATDEAPAYYIVNCAYPVQFAGQWRAAIATGRVRGLCCDASAAADASPGGASADHPADALTLAMEYRRLRSEAPGLNVLGGCVGVDHRHVDAIAQACFG